MLMAKLIHRSDSAKYLQIVDQTKYLIQEKRRLEEKRKHQKHKRALSGTIFI